MNTVSSWLKRRGFIQLVFSSQFKSLHLWWDRGAPVTKKLAAYTSGMAPSMLKAIYRFIGTYAPTQIRLFFRECFACFTKTSWNRILHPLQQHGFIIEDSRCALSFLQSRYFTNWKHLAHGEMKCVTKYVTVMQLYSRANMTMSPVVSKILPKFKIT